ncbi:tetratricopeptide repeat protein [Marinitenerispora sediminis]|uniref:Uncharacterized protein n=1 Tax=Marinitenerispora sediminis TaxID=1931232 RepID=A0A368TBQ5_9ACTN|nr:tetratricopeptide repeat protein [Marinitenerispora sediminis]RCV53597.1 hypothetical protein DEF28_10235 [Marinitenerispora sediminis]RCV55958.1 hypothetical protein DEF23_13525 [Marinitenerispora sediminis]RCV60674.1 hypothetical protein DEF24_06430 [Marinitenerispora sediminis]
MPEEDRERAGEGPARANEVGDVSGAGAAVVQVGELHGNLTLHVGAARLPVPSMLPAPVEPFVDRHTELALVRATGERAARGRTTGVAVLHGFGGLGKTALALRYGHVSHTPPDADRLYASLARRSDGTRPGTSDILAGFLRQYGLPSDAVPALPEERAALFRSITAGRRVVLLIDDADSSAQVRELLPNSPGGVVVVTTRRQLRSLDLAPGADYVPVRPLSGEAAAELLTRMARRDGTGPAGDRHPDAPALRQIAEFCAGVPVALRIVGGYLRRHPAVPLERVAQRLADQRRRLGAFTRFAGPDADPAVRTPSEICDLAYAELPAREARLYRLASLFPGPALNAGVAAALLGPPAGSEDAGDALAALAERHLLEDTGDDSGYRYPKLVELDALRRTEEVDPVAEREAALVRAVLWYTAAAGQADDAVLGRPLRLRDRLPVPGLPEHLDLPFTGRAEALDWLRAERHNLYAVITLAFELGRHAAVVRLCASAWALYDSDKLYVDARAAYTMAVDSASLLGHRGAEALMRDHLARVHTDLGAGALRAAAHPAGRDGRSAEERAADPAHYRALAEREFGIAEEQFALARAAAAETSSRFPLDLAVVLDGTHRLHRERGDHARAAQCLEEVIELHRAAGNARGVALNSYQLGRVHRLAGRPDLARRTLEAALAVGTDAALHARARVELARVLAALGEDTAARGAVDSALVALHGSGQTVRLAEALEVRAELALRAEDQAAWRESLAAAERLYAAVHHPGADRVRAQLDGVDGSGR